MTSLTFVARHWDHLLPLALGDIAIGDGVSLDFRRRDETPNIYSDLAIDVAETSFSQYVQRRNIGDRSVTALPVFIMQGFRHRCIITRQDSPLTDVTQLRGATVGLTGWPDSGNTWTRALVRAAGIDLDSVHWRVGPLIAQHPVRDRIGPRGAGSTVRHTDGDGALVDQLSNGALDAVMTPFMPPGFNSVDSPLRPLFDDVRAQEISYYDRVGYVPGIHVLAVRTELLRRAPQQIDALVRAIEDSKELSNRRHHKLADVTPWLLDEIKIVEQIFGRDWMPYGLEQNRRMIIDFLSEQYEQGLLDTVLDTDELFPFDVRSAVDS